ncbi:hypothetical protein B0T19DRAFT_95206 [Cercophora scortea]|uniref:Uncharacterized protein n=1 Tax=Cercophora scortea TaxID=314031 RepID=A0AAE0MIB4_9PEZI|nr:hypothetical protein B0T19DRAFT_95206 [Cercophora scortea]
MIDYILAQRFPPEWLGCAEHDDSFQTRLKQFLPGGWSDGLLLMKISQILCRGSSLIVQYPANINAGYAKLGQDLLQTYDALVLPVHVNGGNQISTSATETNWVLLVVDWKSGKFTSIAMDEGHAKHWKTKFERLLMAQLHHDHQELGGNPRDSSSSILCCFALEKYLRARYLTRLLATWISTSQLGPAWTPWIGRTQPRQSSSSSDPTH